MTYHLQALTADERIMVTTDSPSDSLKALTVIEGSEEKEGQVSLPFNQNTAQMLFTFLKSVKFEMNNKTKAVLRALLDGKNLNNPNYEWEVDLTDLKDKMYSKTGKVKTEWDLIHYLPLRYVNKSNPQSVVDLVEKEPAVVIGEIVSIKEHVRKTPAVVITIQDVNRIEITAWFFHQSWLMHKYHVGDNVVLSGTYSIRENRYNGQRTAQLVNAEINPLDTYNNSKKISAIYSEKAGKKKYRIARDIETLLAKYCWINDPVPEGLLKKYGLLSRNEAYRAIHAPETLEEAAKARERIAFDDFIRLQIYLFQKKQRSIQEQQGYISADTTWADEFISSLPFSLTGAQQRVISEIQQDMASDHPMSRLVHGEVGSGKTEIALAAALTAVKSGGQVALLAPTSILASQLYERFVDNIRKAGFDEKISVELLVSDTKKSKRTDILKRLENGSLNILVGTHSLINKEVKFKQLSLIVIDEQHKFGTEHRKALKENHLETVGKTPDMMMMSATPIPRTMAQTVYGDLDVSVIDELPASRKPVLTYWDETDEGAWDIIQQEVEAGHQAYVIASLVDESESEALENVENATATQTFLQTSIFPQYNVGLVHGQLKNDEKDEVLESFYRNETQILVSTSVVEVGVNVPNATVMVVLNANRFGIASLHQIRGRVGRGKDQGYCFLIGEATNPDAEERLSALVASNDGFWLSEKDLEIRGEGSLLKANQHGMNDLLVANLKEYKPLLGIARSVAEKASKSKRMLAEVAILLGKA